MSNEQEREIKVNAFQLLQWKTWIKSEIRMGKALRHSSGRSVKAHAARVFGLAPRTKRETVLEHVEAALLVVTASGASLTQTVGLICE